MPALKRLPKSWRIARATIAIAVLTSLAWLILPLLPLGDAVQDLPTWAVLGASLFIHASFLHLGLNLLALILFGRAVEGAVGSLGFILLYLAGHAAAVGAFQLLHPAGLFWLGAGGGAGAVLGAYALLFGRNRAERGRDRLAKWRYALWLCVGWIALALLVGATFAGSLTIHYAPAYAAAFLLGIILAKPLILFNYRNA
jgi:membrane associated rhomboid family serine protease